MFARYLFISLAAGAIAVAAPAQAQLGQSDSYKFLQAIKDSKGDDVEKLLNAPGTTIINTRSRDSGESALYVVAKRGDLTYVRYLLARGADPNIKDNAGNTPLMAAVVGGYGELIDPLVKGHADVNLANRGGETPLILAVQRRDIDMIRTLLSNGADPDQRDHLQGLSAREYAHQDPRGVPMAKVIDGTPKKAKAQVAGPKF
ncbi:MAG: ankyrin repeat domain-containing protein [Sphingomonas sp.]